MTVEERRRIALHRAAAASWGEEVADTLVELVAPFEREPAAREDVEAVRGDLDAVRGDLEAVEERLGVRIESLGHELQAGFERRISDAITHQTRTLVFSQLGALVVVAGLAFGLA